MHEWQLWKLGKPLKTIEGISPLLASWESKAHPAQLRLKKYLDELGTAFRSVLSGAADLCLHMEIDTKDQSRLVHHYDLENYLTPVIYALGAAAFRFVSAKKQVGGGSRISIGFATNALDAEMAGWQHFSHSSGSGVQTKRWKAELREAVLASQPTPVPPGSAEVHLAWRCSPKRNWVWLWKPTGDAMGPILGEPIASNPFDPDDGRIFYLGLHLNKDATVGHSVDVGMWWRSSPQAADS